jgi:hypothetical protein
MNMRKVHVFFAGRKNPCKGVWIFRAREAKTMRKVHGFFCRTKKPMQRCMSFSSQKGQNHAKTAWVFSPDEKTHTKVYGFFFS